MLTLLTDLLRPVGALGAAPGGQPWAQGTAETSGLGGLVDQALNWGRDLLETGPLTIGGVVVLAVVGLWLIQKALSAGRTGSPGDAAAPSASQLRRQAKRAQGQQDFRTAGELFEQVGDLAEAGAMYEAAQAFAEAGRVFEALKDAPRAARAYERAGNAQRAAEVWEASGQFAKAAALYQKLGSETRAAGAFERGREYDKAAAIYRKLESFERAADLSVKAGNVAAAAECMDLHLQRVKAAGGREGFLGPEEVARLAGMARTCAQLYDRAGNPARAAAVLQEGGLHREAADLFVKAGDGPRALELYKEARDFARAAEVARQLGDERECQLALASDHLQAGRTREAAEAFAAAGAPSRAAEVYESLHEFGQAARLFAEAGEDEKAGEMFLAAGQPREAGGAYERARRYREASQCYLQAGEAAKAAQALEAAGEYYEAGAVLLEQGDVNGAMERLQKVTPASERYLAATLALGEIFLEKKEFSLAREKFQRAVAGREVSADFVEPFYRLAVAHERSGELPQALAFFEKVMAEQVGFRDVKERVASLRARVGQGQTADRTGAAGGPPDLQATMLVTPPTPVAGSRRRYRLLEEIGRGGMGIVYKAEDEVLKRIVAYKVLPPQIADDPKILEYFLREARIAASLRHPNVVVIYDAGEDEGGVYIAMEFLEGISLHRFLQAKGVLSPAEIVFVARQVCRGLEHAHGKGVIHRDITPGNIMIGKDKVVKLMDFGLATLTRAALRAQTSVKGTPLYMAPEQILGDDLNHQVDIYAFGCVLYRMGTGRPPFEKGDVLYHHLHTPPDPPRSLNPKMPEWLEQAILTCLEKDRQRRYPEIRHLREEIERHWRRGG